MAVFRDVFEQCPRCGIDLVDARSARGCRRCGGMWLREDVLTDMVLRMLPSGAIGRLVFTQQPPIDPRIGCPTCHAAMESANLHGVQLDRCTRHGIWFDPDELQDVLRRAADPERPSIVEPLPRISPAAKPRVRANPPAGSEPAARPGVPELRFRLMRGTSITPVVVRRDIIKIGRLPSSHVRLADDSGASRMHAVIEAQAIDNVSLIDLGSTAGTLVNGEKMIKGRLATGDVIEIGDTAIEVEIAP